MNAETEHSPAAHKHDRQSSGWPTCPRCLEIAIAYHDEHGLEVPDDIRYRYTLRPVTVLRTTGRAS